MRKLKRCDIKEFCFQADASKFFCLLFFRWYVSVAVFLPRKFCTSHFHLRSFSHNNFHREKSFSRLIAITKMPEKITEKNKQKEALVLRGLIGVWNLWNRQHRSICYRAAHKWHSSLFSLSQKYPFQCVFCLIVGKLVVLGSKPDLSSGCHTFFCARWDFSPHLWALAEIEKSSVFNPPKW